MKIKLLMTGLLGLVSATTFAQKSELSNAQSSLTTYQVSSTQKGLAVMVTKANSSLQDAKTSIDKASTNEKTAALPLTFALKASIYAELAFRDSVLSTSAPLFVTADEAFKKAKELDTKGENKGILDNASRTLANYELTLGVKQYQNKEYEKAYHSFDYFRQIAPEDTNAVYYTALAASNAGTTDPKYYPLAISNYDKLLTLKYSGNAGTYMNLSAMYLLSKDTVNALKAAGDGVTKYPLNNELRKREIEIALQSGKQAEVLDKIMAAITADPKNKVLYYYAGLTYSQVGDEAEAKSAKAKTDAEKKSLHQTANDDYVKAADNYKKSLDVDPDYFESNLNLGYVLMKPAIELYNQARELPSNAPQKQYDDIRYKADALFDIAKPYLQKAVDLKPKSIDALNNLRNYYRGKYDKVHTKENADKAADLKKQVDALK
jgi:hypothetical protein